MQRNSLKFDPTIARLAMPTGENFGTALGKGLQQLGATVNMAHDRNRKEMFEDKAESRASEKHGWAGETHAQNMTKGQQDIDFNAQANPLRLEGMTLGNTATKQSIDFNSAMNPLKLQGKQIQNATGTQALQQSAELHPLNIDALKLANQTKGQNLKINWGSYLSREKAKAQDYDINAAKEQTRKEFVPLKVAYEKKRVDAYGKPKKTTAQLDFEYGVEHPDFAKRQEKRREVESTSTLSKKDKQFRTTLLRDARKIKDPLKRKEAYALIRGGGDLSDISDKVATIANDVAVTLDHKKAREQNAIKVADAQSTFDVFDRLIDNYDDSYVGAVDNRLADVTGVFEATTDPKQQAYKTDLGRLTLVAKKLENMGASFTKSEQEMMQKAMPNPNMSESSYKAQLASYVTTMRDIAKNKLLALDAANYDTGKLKTFIEKMDKTAEKANAFAGNASPSSQQTKHQKQSLYKKKKTIVKRGTHNGRKVVQYSDGSVAYVD